MNKKIRWEIRFSDLETGKDKVYSRDTRKNARALMRLLKRHPDTATNVRMYRVNEYIDRDGNPTITFHKRAR